MKKHFEVLKENKIFMISEMPEEGRDLDEESVKLIKTFNAMELVDLRQHEDFYNNSIGFVKEEITALRDKIVGIQNEIKSSYEDLNRN